MRDLIEEFVARRTWAVVGVSTNPRKFGTIIFRDMRNVGYLVYGVHPSGEAVDGQKIYARLADLPELPEVVDVVVPPAVTEQVVQECHALGLTRVWLQPGAESYAAVQFCRENGLQVIYGGPCAMVEKIRWR